MATRPGAWRFPSLTCRSPPGSWSTARATRTGRLRPSLAGELGGLPLALEQAAAFMPAIGDNLAEYLALFRQQRAGLLARGEPMGYGKTVARTWALAFGRLGRAEPGGMGCCGCWRVARPRRSRCACCCNPAPGSQGDSAQVVPVLTPLLENRLAAGDAVGALRRYSLVTPAGDGSVSVHRLVQAVTLDQMPADLAGQWRQAAAALIAAAIPADTPAGELARLRRAAAARPGGTRR